MSNKPSYRIVAGLLLGIIAGVILDNIPAGVCLGTAIGILGMLVAFTAVERKNGN
jgi:F0F1-type ATP synthase assembly protein I